MLQLPLLAWIRWELSGDQGIVLSNLALYLYSQGTGPTFDTYEGIIFKYNLCIVVHLNRRVSRALPDVIKAIMNVIKHG